MRIALLVALLGGVLLHAAFTIERSTSRLLECAQQLNAYPEDPTALALARSTKFPVLLYRAGVVVYTTVGIGAVLLPWGILWHREKRSGKSH